MSREVLGRQWDQTPEGVVLRRELGVKREGPKRTKHPKSGFSVEVGRETRLQPGSSPPMLDVLEHGHFPGRGPVVRGLGMGPKKVGERAVKHVYRGVSEADYQGIMERGHMQSDQRGNVCSTEGTCATDDPRGAMVYGRDVRNYRVLKIRVHPEDEWKVDPRDSYIKTQQPIPIDRIVRVTSPQVSERGRESK